MDQSMPPPTHPLTRTHVPLVQIVEPRMGDAGHALVESDAETLGR